jgi:hypothetical protein
MTATPAAAFARPMRIAHISDPHFGTEVPAVRSALLEALHAAPPDLIILTGDITQRARRGQFRLAAAFLGELPDVPRVCVPGNHDLPLFDLFTRLLRPYARYRRFMMRNLEPEFVDARLAVLCVDATRRTRHTDGVLTGPHIDRVAARLRSLTAPFRLIATHQPLVVPIGSERHNVAHGAPLALQAWIPAGADMFLGGHIHLPYCLEARTPDGAATGVVMQAGTCLSHRVRAGIPNSYNALSLHYVGAQRQMRIEQRTFDAAQGRFVTAMTHEANEPASAGRSELNRWTLSCVA